MLENFHFHHAVEAIVGFATVRKMRQSGKIEIDIQPWLNKLIWIIIGTGFAVYMATHDNTRDIAAMQKTVADYIAYQSQKDQRQDANVKELAAKEDANFNIVRDKLDDIYKVMKQR